jgi:hypothetical protein
MRHRTVGASLLFFAVASPAGADIGAWSVTRYGMTTQLGSATGGGVSVVVGLNGEIWSSPDGAAWFPHANPEPGGRLEAATWGAGRFVAVGYDGYGSPRILTSPDGTAWSQQVVNGGLLSGVAYGDGRYVAVAHDGVVVRSLDAASWTPVSVPGAGGLSGVAWGGGLFVAVGEQRRLLTSPDGAAWIDRTASVPAAMSHLAEAVWTGSRFVVAGLTGIMTSPDGVAWTRVDARSYSSVAAGPGIVVAMGWEGEYATSATGEAWTVRFLPVMPGGAAHVLTVSYGDGRFVAAGESGVLHTSVDGTNWTNRMLPASRSFQALAHGGGRFCATGPHRGAAVSADGAAWANATTGALDIGRDVLWTGARFVSVGSGAGFGGAIATSLDCVGWTPSAWSLPPGVFSAAFEAVAQGAGGRLVAVGEQSVDAGRVPLIAASTDGGASWTAVGSGLGSTEGVLRAVVYGGGRWVASGWRYEGGPLVTVSTNGVTWTSPPPDYDLETVESLAYGAGLFVAAGDSLWTSPDGQQWTNVTGSLYEPSYRHVRFFDGQFVAAGQSNATGGVLAVSPNGTAWTHLPQPRALAAAAFTEDGTRRVAAVGDSIVLLAQAGLPGVTVAAAPAAEASSNAPVVLSLTAAAAAAVTVAYRTADGTASSASDYGARDGLLTFPAGSTQQVVDVPLVADGLAEGNETFRLLVPQAEGAVVRDALTTVTVVDTPTIAAEDAAATEGNAGPSPAGLVVRLSHAAALPVTVAYATGGGTATAGTDYASASGTLTFAPGASVLTAPVSVLGDLAVEPDETFALTLSSPANASLADSSAEALIQDDDAPPLAQREVAHGMLVREDFGAPAGADVFRVAQATRASYEIAVDAIAGDAVPVVLERLAADNATVIGTGAPTGTGTSVSLRWANGAAGTVSNQHVRVRAACAAACDPGDAYRLRAYETTLRAPRFSNVGGQVTLLVLQNPSDAAVAATAYFWAADGTLLHAHPAALATRQTLVLNTAGVGVLAGRSGSVTVAHTAPYGVLAGKAVAVEPATGFSFDTPLAARPR